jgi:acetyl esterase/lipase
MRRVVVLSLLASAVFAAEPPAQPIWPKGAPNDPAAPGEEKDTTKPTDNLVAGRKVVRLGNVNNPTIAIYRPAKDQDTGAAVVVFPGGGYNILAMDLEGVEVCEWLNSIGVTGVLLKYRVPARKDRPRYAAPLEDAQRAYDRIDAADDASCRPDFTLLIYPAYLTVREKNDEISPELKIDDHTPPTFLVQTEDDGVRVENSLFYYAALRKAKVPAEMHIYPAGGHGYGLRRTEKTVTTWPTRAEEWLRSLGVLKP